MMVQKMMLALASAVTLHDTVRSAKGLFARRDIHHSMVVDGAKLVNVFCEVELNRLVRFYIESLIYSIPVLAMLKQRLSQVVMRNPKRLSATASVLQAMKLFNEYSSGCISVIDAKDVPVGIVPRSDLIKCIPISFAAEQGSE